MPEIILVRRHGIYLVIHYTAGLGLHGTVAWLRNPAAKASAHLVIGRRDWGRTGRL